MINSRNKRLTRKMKVVELRELENKNYYISKNRQEDK